MESFAGDMDLPPQVLPGRAGSTLGLIYRRTRASQLSLTSRSRVRGGGGGNALSLDIWSNTWYEQHARGDFLMDLTEPAQFSASSLPSGVSSNTESRHRRPGPSWHGRA